MKIIVDKMPERDFECLFYATESGISFCGIPFRSRCPCHVENGKSCPFLAVKTNRLMNDIREKEDYNGDISS